jgi:hypothetical protein
MRRSICLALLAAALGPGTGAGVAQTDGPRARFDDDLIGRLEGHWDLTRRIRGTVVHNTVSASWVLNHQFLQLQMKDVNQPPGYEAIVLIGFIHASQQYVAHWIDTFGGRFSAMGTGQRNGDAIEFRFDYPDGPFFNTFSWSPETKEWTFRGENQDASGQRKLFFLDTLTRQP